MHSVALNNEEILIFGGCDFEENKFGGRDTEENKFHLFDIRTETVSSIDVNGVFQFIKPGFGP